MKTSHTIRLERIEEGQERAYGVAERDGWSWTCRNCDAVGPECAEADEATTSAAVHLALTQEPWRFSTTTRTLARGLR